MQIRHIRYYVYPIIYGLIIPVFIGYDVSVESKHQELLVLIGSIFVFTHAIEFYQVINRRKSTPNSTYHIFNSKSMIKIGMIMSFSFLSLFIAINVITHQDFPLDPNESSQSPETQEITSVNSIIVFSTVFLTIPLLLSVSGAGYHYGYALGYLKLARRSSKLEDKIEYYHNAIYNYQKSLDDIYGMKLNNENKILSWILAEKKGDVSYKMEKFENEFKDDITRPALFLADITEHDKKELFVKIPEHEKWDMWFRRLGSIGIIVGVIITVVLHFISNP